MPIFNIYGPTSSGKGMILEGLKKCKDTGLTDGNNFRLKTQFISDIWGKYSYIIVDIAPALSKENLQEFLYLGMEADKILYLISQEPMDIRCPHSKVAMQYFGEQMPGDKKIERFKEAVQQLKEQAEQEEAQPPKEICRISIPVSLDMLVDMLSAIATEYRLRKKPLPRMNTTEDYISIIESTSPDTGATLEA